MYVGDCGGLRLDRMGVCSDVGKGFGVITPTGLGKKNVFHVEKCYFKLF